MKKLIVVALLLSAGAAQADYFGGEIGKFAGNVKAQIRGQADAALRKQEMFEKKAQELKARAKQDPDVRMLMEANETQAKAAENLANRLRRQIR